MVPWEIGGNALSFVFTSGTLLQYNGMVKCNELAMADLTKPQPYFASKCLAQAQGGGDSHTVPPPGVSHLLQAEGEKGHGDKLH